MNALKVWGDLQPLFLRVTAEADGLCKTMDSVWVTAEVRSGLKKHTNQCARSEDQLGEGFSCLWLIQLVLRQILWLFHKHT